MQCGGPVASPDSVLNNEVIYGKNNRILHTQQLPEKGDEVGAPRGMWEAAPFRDAPEEVGLAKPMAITGQRFMGPVAGSIARVLTLLGAVFFNGDGIYPRENTPARAAVAAGGDNTR